MQHSIRFIYLGRLTKAEDIIWFQIDVNTHQ